MEQLSRVLGGETAMDAPNPSTSFRAANEAAVALQPQLAQYEASCNRVAQQIATLTRAINGLNQSFEQIKSEKESYADLHKKAEGRLGDVQRVVERYAVVHHPVVASDGYTYERDTIKKYLDDCKNSSTQPTSQQTQSVLTSTLIPNQSLKKLVDLLKAFKPKDAPLSPAGDGQGSMGPKGGESLHPCIRVYGYCNYKEGCAYANYPFDACLSHLKGKCRFGAQCHELHVDLKKDDKGRK